MLRGARIDEQPIAADDTISRSRDNNRQVAQTLLLTRGIFVVACSNRGPICRDFPTSASAALLGLGLPPGAAATPGGTAAHPLSMLTKPELHRGQPDDLKPNGGLNPAEERHVSITFEYHSNFSLFISNEGDWHIADIAGRVKFHLIKGIRSPLTRDVLLDDSGGRGIRE
ncbi:hypothetical protein DBV15_01791 [Temnothorax longispinosus]|uniref:Uncharacterized protein n=1 Tax=Temnothorax longispinosus TaxID=300112 RepID=A0A4S2KM97_9HYME|nr:hypothetical protein DBV15_01791 [Temnothorax longispinosus]